MCRETDKSRAYTRLLGFQIFSLMLLIAKHKYSCYLAYKKQSAYFERHAYRAVVFNRIEIAYRHRYAPSEGDKKPSLSDGSKY